MSKNSMLVIDDSRLSRSMVKSFALNKQPSWNIEEAEDAKSAMEMSDIKEYAYITVDYNMPGMDGLELAKLLKGKFPQAKIAMITANIQNSLKTASEEIGVLFIEKPITEAKITQFVGG